MFVSWGKSGEEDSCERFCVDSILPVDEVK